MIPAGAREALWHTPDGHAVRRFDWPAASDRPRGAILFMPGRGDAYEKYLASFHHWHDRGWHVSAADWRGQAGSGRLGLDDRTGHVDDFSVWLQDLAAFWADWASDRPGPLVLIGHSMGGHLVLRAVADGLLHPAPAALVLSAPMLDILPARVPAVAKYWFARVRRAMGDRRRPAWKQGEMPLSSVAARQGLLTHDSGCYGDELWWREQRPQIHMGAASWGWIVAALASIRHLKRPRILRCVSVPVFMLATTADRLVSPPAIARAAALLPDAQCLWFGAEAAHEILREAEPVRRRALDGIDAFLDRVCPS